MFDALYENIKSMLYSLGASGRTIYLSVNQYCEMTDDDFKMITAYEQGFYLSHPFMDTCLIDNCKGDVEEPEEEEQWEDEDDQDALFDANDLEELMAAEHND